MRVAVDRRADALIRETGERGKGVAGSEQFLLCQLSQPQSLRLDSIKVLRQGAGDGNLRRGPFHAEATQGGREIIGDKPLAAAGTARGAHIEGAQTKGTCGFWTGKAATKPFPQGGPTTREGGGRGCGT